MRDPPPREQTAIEAKRRKQTQALVDEVTEKRIKYNIHDPANILDLDEISLHVERYVQEILNAISKDDPSSRVFVESITKKSGFFTVILAVNGLGERYWPWIVFNGETQFEPNLRWVEPFGWCVVSFNPNHFNNQVLHHEYLRTNVIPNVGRNAHTGEKDPAQWSMVIHDSSTTHGPHPRISELLRTNKCCEVVIPGGLSKFSVLDDTYNRMFKTRYDKVRESFMVRWRGLDEGDPKKKLTAAQWREVICFWVMEALFDEKPSRKGARPPSSATYWAFQKLGLTVPSTPLRTPLFTDTRLRGSPDHRPDPD
jgi:hypothetical protein